MELLLFVVAFAFAVVLYRLLLGGFDEERVETYRAEHDRRPPYWTLVELARGALADTREELAPSLR